MYKRITAIALVIIFAISCSGCSGPWRRKFVRKKTEEVKEEPVLYPMDYSKEFTNKQLYANHFAFWKSAESEFISCLKAQKNTKRLRTYTSYAIEELKKLHDLLVEEKQKEISPFLEELKEIVSKAGQPNYIDSHRNLLVSTSSKHYRAVSRKFSYYSMREYIQTEEKPEAPEKLKKPEEELEKPTELKKQKLEEGPEEPEESEKREELKKPEVLEPEKSEEPNKPGVIEPERPEGPESLEVPEPEKLGELKGTEAVPMEPETSEEKLEKPETPGESEKSDETKSE